MELTDEDLSDGATGREAENVGPHARILRHEGQRVLELAGAAGDVHAEPLADARVDQPGAQDEVRGHDGHAHEVVSAHHLGARVGLEGAEDVVLRAVGEAVEQEVNAQQQQAPRAIPLRRAAAAAAVALALLARVQREDGDAGGHGGDDHVLVQRVALLEDGDVQEHDGQQLAALGEQEGDVVDVGERGVAEGGGEGARQRDEEQRHQDARRRDDGRHGRALGRAEPQIHGARRGGEERLDGVQEHGVLEQLGLAWRAVRCRRELFLEIRPGEAIPTHHHVSCEPPTRHARLVVYRPRA